MKQSNHKPINTKPRAQSVPQIGSEKHLQLEDQAENSKIAKSFPQFTKSSAIEIPKAEPYQHLGKKLEYFPKNADISRVCDTPDNQISVFGWEMSFNVDYRIDYTDSDEEKKETEDEIYAETLESFFLSEEEKKENEDEIVGEDKGDFFWME